MWEGMNQRRFPRVNCKCRIKVFADGGKMDIEAVTENLGAGGICVVLDKKLDLFEKVGLELFLTQDGEPVECKGEVVWVVRNHPMTPSGRSSYDTGIEFVAMPASQKEAIDQIMAQLLRASA